MPSCKANLARAVGRHRARSLAAPAIRAAPDLQPRHAYPPKGALSRTPRSHGSSTRARSASFPAKSSSAHSGSSSGSTHGGGGGGHGGARGHGGQGRSFSFSGAHVVACYGAMLVVTLPALGKTLVVLCEGKAAAAAGVCPRVPSKEAATCV
jgi:hypothetical protein